MNRSHAESAGQPGTAQFFLGRNERGQWVLRDLEHRRGGLFVNRDAALRYALDEAGDQPQSITLVPGILELDLTATQPAAERPAMAAADQAARRYCVAQDLI